jgi:hypothetical protein
MIVLDPDCEVNYAQDTKTTAFLNGGEWLRFRLFRGRSCGECVRGRRSIASNGHVPTNGRNERPLSNAGQEVRKDIKNWRVRKLDAAQV